MVQVISLWIKDPVSSWDKDESLVGVKFKSRHSMLSAFCEEDVVHYDDFVLQDVKIKDVTEINGMKIVSYEITCKTLYQEKHSDVNQASWEVRILIAEWKE